MSAPITEHVLQNILTGSIHSLPSKPTECAVARDWTEFQGIHVIESWKKKKTKKRCYVLYNKVGNCHGYCGNKKKRQKKPYIIQDSFIWRQRSHKIKLIKTDGRHYSTYSVYLWGKGTDWEKHRAPLGMQRRRSAFIKVTIWCIPVVLNLPNVTLSDSFSHHQVILVATS